MALGVLNIGIAEVASVLVLGIEKVRFGLVMSLGTFAFIIPKNMQQKVYYFLALLSLRPTFGKLKVSNMYVTCKFSKAWAFLISK